MDHADWIVERLERVDADMGAYLLRCLAEPGGPARRRPPVGSTAWIRARMLEWCQTPSVRERFDLDAVESTRIAVRQLSDEELRLLAVDLVGRSGRAQAAASRPPWNGAHSRPPRNPG